MDIRQKFQVALNVTLCQILHILVVPNAAKDRETKIGGTSRNHCSRRG